MQATAQNPGVADILRVNIKRMVLQTFLVTRRWWRWCPS